jgi:hypothetical protein
MMHSRAKRVFILQHEAYFESKSFVDVREAFSNLYSEETVLNGNKILRDKVFAVKKHVRRRIMLTDVTLRLDMTGNSQYCEKKLLYLVSALLVVAFSHLSLFESRPYPARLLSTGISQRKNFLE